MDLTVISSLGDLSSMIVDCTSCPRLIGWCRDVAEKKRAAYSDEIYWGKPVPGFGDPNARIAVVGLAPAAHGANRTGRMFTGDRSGDWLFRGLYRAGLANQPNATHVEDGLELSDVWVTSALKCAPPMNKPSAAEQNTCRPYLTREIELLENLRVVVSLGGIGTSAVARHFGLTPRPKFGHGVEARIDEQRVLLCSYHVSQQNTFTGRLTESMLDDIFGRAVELASVPVD